MSSWKNRKIEEGMELDHSRSPLYLPQQLHNELDQIERDVERQAREQAIAEMEGNSERESDKREALSGKTDASSEGEGIRTKGSPFKRSVLVFNLDDADKLEKGVEGKSYDARKRYAYCAKAMKAHNGYRRVIDFADVKKALASLKKPFENFIEVIEHYEREFAISGVSKPENFRVQPVLLDGDPGVGKTAFVQALGKALGLPFRKFSAGGLQSPAQFTGGAAYWGNTQPGEIFNTIVSGESANLVMLIDEVDKIGNRSELPVIPALLELLEPESSRRFKDESMEVCFDASRLITLMTSNDKSKMDAALLSRCKVFTIGMPTIAQRMYVARSEHGKINEGLTNRCNRTKLDEDALQSVVESDLSIRSLIAVVREACATALSTNSKIAIPTLSSAEEEVEGADEYQRHDIGFGAQIDRRTT